MLDIFLTFQNLLFVFISLVLCFKGVGYTYHILSFYKLLKQNSVAKDDKSKLKSKVKLKILLPLYQEQKILHSLLYTFQQLTVNYPDINILLITTAKEEKIGDNPTTFELAEQIIQEHSLNQFSVINYPHKDGVMAHQLNFAITHLLENPDVKSSETFIAVYNADSKPSKRTIESFFENIYSNPTAKVFQQVAIFTQNYSAYKNTFIGIILKASAIIQTRWSLGFETKMLKNQSSYWQRQKDKEQNLFEMLAEPISYCVGHGLFIRLDTIFTIGGFPTETLNEDLPLGYYLGLAKIPINLLPVIESADNPGNLKSLINQKRSWFWGMVDYLSYSRYASKKIPDVNKTRIILSSLKGLIRDAFAWLLMGPVIIYLILFSFFHHDLLIIFFTSFTLVLYAVLPAFLIELSLNFLHKQSDGSEIETNFLDYSLVPLFSILYLIISSIGPWISFVNLIRNKLYGVKLVKPKTEH